MSGLCWFLVGAPARALPGGSWLGGGQPGNIGRWAYVVLAAREVSAVQYLFATVAAV